ncbi:hypothetical protein Hanom_Chr13g01201531 [Helianthus anomalus]
MMKFVMPTTLMKIFLLSQKKFAQEVEDILKRKVEERQGDVPVINEDEIMFDKTKWFKDLKSERKLPRSLKFFTQHKEIFIGDIISWIWIPKLRRIAIRREYSEQYFQFINDIKSLPWWNVKKLCRIS